MLPAIMKTSVMRQRTLALLKGKKSLLTIGANTPCLFVAKSLEKNLAF